VKLFEHPDFAQAVKGFDTVRSFLHDRQTLERAGWQRYDGL
jgi:hypothetical protein